MPDIRRCAIYGCKSNSREHKNLKFFNFPARDNPLYEIWLLICHESSDSIRWQRRPYICSKHFNEKDVGFRRLATGAVPALYLSAPPGFAEEEAARLAEIEAIQAEKIRQVKLVNDAVLEWARRAQHYAETASACTTRRELRKIATDVRNLLGATLTLNVDDYWLRKFRRSHLFQLEVLDTENSNKTLDLVSIITELDPSARIFSDDEIAVLVKEEEAKLVQIELKKKTQKKHASPDTGKNSKFSGKSFGSKMKFEDTSSDGYVRSEFDTKDDSNSSSTPFGTNYVQYDSIDLCNDGYNSLEDSEPDVKRELVIASYQQALEHLKPLEDFALREENYRAIGLLSTLEIIFKNPRQDK